jgi:hypothetical protein
MIKRLLLVVALGVTLSGCFMAPLALIGPMSSGFTTASIIQSGVNPEDIGPIKAKGAIKHPDKVTPNATTKSNLLIIESPFFLKSLYFLENKKKGEINNFDSTLSCNYFFKCADLFAIIGKFL